MTTSPIDISTSYWTHYRATKAGDSDLATAHEWAAALVDDSIERHSQRLLDLLVTIADQATSNAELAYFAAGPVEELLYRYGSDVIDDVRDASRRSAKFRQALRLVWIDPASKPDVAALISDVARDD